MGNFIKKAKKNWVLIANSILLIVIIFLTGYYSSISKMNLLDVNDEKFAQEIADMQKSVEAQQLARQPYLGDYIELNPASLSYASNNVLTVTGFDPRTVLQVGDKIRLTQGGVTKYFYVVLLSATQITLNAGSDYTYTNTALTLFGYSRVTNPSGHPLNFAFSPTVRNYGTGNTIATTTAIFRYTMNGNIVSIYYDFRNISGIAPAAVSVDFSLPFPARTETPDVGFAQQLGNTALTGATQNVANATFIKTAYSNAGAIVVNPNTYGGTFTLFVFTGKIDLIY